MVQHLSPWVYSAQNGLKLFLTNMICFLIYYWVPILIHFPTICQRKMEGVGECQPCSLFPTHVTMGLPMVTVVTHALALPEPTPQLRLLFVMFDVRSFPRLDRYTYPAYEIIPLICRFQRYQYYLADKCYATTLNGLSARSSHKNGN
jgi:hypothetical protein